MSNAANLEAKQFSMECIETALLGLMKEKPYNEITYSEIAIRAGFSRNAIYRNFSSMDNILEHYVIKKTEAFLQKTNKYESYPEYLKMLFKHLYKMKDDSKILLEAGKESILHKAFMHLRNCFTDVDNSLREYYDYYRIGGIYSVYIHWIETGFKETPNELCDIILQVMNIYGIVPDNRNK